MIRSLDVEFRPTPARAALRAILTVFLSFLAVMPAPAADWATFWSSVEKANKNGQGLRVAESRRKDPACQDVGRILEAIPLLVAAIEAKRYGDAVVVLAEYQRRLMCLDAPSLVALDTLLGLQSATGADQLKEDERNKLLRALFALGLLSYDQIPSSNKSVWWMLLYGDQDRYAQALKDYPEVDLGLWTFNVHNGQLERFNSQAAARQMLDALALSSDLVNKNCYVGEMRSKSEGSGSSKAAQNDKSQMGCAVSPRNPDGRGGGPESGAAAGAVACALTVANAKGLKAQLQCMSKVLAGVMPDPRDMHSLPRTELAGIPDRACTRSDQTSDKSDANLLEDQKDKKWYEHLGEYALNVFLAVFDKTPDPLLSGDLLSPEAAESMGKGLEGWQFMAFDKLVEPGTEGYAEEREKFTNMTTAEKQQYLIDKKKEKEEKEKAKQQQAGAEPEEGRKIDPGLGGTCSDRTGAAARAAAAYSCITGEVTLPDGTTVPPRPPIPPQGMSVDPDNQTSLPGSMGQPGSAMLACLQQGGGQIRVQAVDTRCAKARCIEGQTCACDKPGFQGEIATTVQQVQTRECRVFARCEAGEECPCDRVNAQPGEKLPEYTPAPMPTLPGQFELPDMPQLPGGGPPRP